MVNYNLSGFNNTGVNITTYFIQANQFTNDWFGALTTLAFFTIIFVSLKQFGNSPAATAAAGVTVLFALLGRALLLISDQVLYISMILVAVVAIYAYLSK